MRLNLLSRTSDPPELVNKIATGQIEYRVFCNGERIHLWMTADTETGEVTGFKTDANGKPMSLPGGTVLIPIRRTGEITIEEILAAPTV